MSRSQDELTAAAKAATLHVNTSADASNLPFRRNLTFPKLSAEMLERLHLYGEAAVFAADTLLYTYGDRDTDMFVVLSGEIESRLLVDRGGLN